MNSVAERLIDYLHKVVYEPNNASLDLSTMPDEFKEFAEEFIYFSDCFIETMAFAKSLAKGNLDVNVPSPGNEIAAPLKDLHSTLKHLAWQAQQVANGDYHQHVDFMGDFSEAFNDMVEQLRRQRVALISEVEKSKKEINMLAQNKSIYDLFESQISPWIVVVDADNKRWLFVSREADYTLNDKEWKAQVNKWINRQADLLLDLNDVYTTEFEFNGKLESQYYLVSIHSLMWHGKKALAFVLTDITTERRRLNSLQNIANYDALTQVYNRRCGMEILDEWSKEGKGFILCFVDIDDLKYVNDRFGHAEGDQYIMCISGILSDFSPDVKVSRIGGDEFMILAEGFDYDSAKKRMEELRDKLSEYNDKDDVSIYHSMSYGIVEVEKGSELLPRDILSLADERMYEYKRVLKLKRRMELKNLQNTK